MLSLSGYQAANDSVALSDQTDRVRFEVNGPDRAKFLHNLTTNEVKRLPAGRGCEAFVTSLQGKILALVKLLVCEDSILVSTDPGGLLLALPHFQKYGVFDDIGLEDRSDTTFEFHLVGPRADELLVACGATLPEPVTLALVATSVGETPVLVWRESPTGRPGLTVMGARGATGKVAAALKTSGQALKLTELEPEAFEVLRVEAGTPVFGRDLTEKNLPQEAGRDSQAINFVKGCYLGQETVARIDALGHVNQILKGLRLSKGMVPPPPGTEVQDAGKRVGFVTSSVHSPGWSAPIALALIRTSHSTAGTSVALVSPGEPEYQASAVVADLPMIPPPHPDSST